MYVNNLTGPWFSIYNVRKCKVERNHVTQSSELHAAPALMRPKRVVMKFDKLLIVFVRKTC